MNILILTQPLGNNYGGLLQAFALQHFLKKMGHVVFTEDRKRNTDNRTFIIKLLSKIKGKMNPYTKTEKKVRIVSSNTDKFIHTYINTTVPVFSTSKEELKQYHFDAYIVGSDQVWRPSFSWGIYNYFLDFVQSDSVKRIAYAASFGTDNWEFSKEQEDVCKTLIKRFTAISVREDSGITMCERYFGITPELVLDPTLLLDVNDYNQLIDNDCSENDYSGKIMTYVLNHKRKENYYIIDKVSSLFQKEYILGYPRKRIEEVKGQNIEECVIRPVEFWLKGIRDSDYIVTDSFHGIVFALLFHKQFIVIDNNVSGSSRLTSILKLVGLSDRLVKSIDDVSEQLLSNQIDYSFVDRVLDIERNKSIKFLTKSLST